MTVDRATGEVVEPLGAEDAVALTGRIRSLAEAIADRVDLLLVKVREARDGDAHLAMGYRSWTEYVETELADVLPRLDRQPRRELVAALAETGVPVEAIATVAQVSESTVHRDIRQGVSSDTPSPPVTGRDGKTYTRPEPHAHITQTTRTTEATKVETDVDTTTGEVVEPKPSRPPLPPAPPLRSPEQVNAEQFAERFAGQVVALLSLKHDHMRNQARVDWHRGSEGASPAQRQYVTPANMREVAHGLLALAEEWERADEHAA